MVLFGARLGVGLRVPQQAQSPLPAFSTQSLPAEPTRTLMVWLFFHFSSLSIPGFIYYSLSSPVVPAVASRLTVHFHFFFLSFFHVSLYLRLTGASWSSGRKLAGMKWRGDTKNMMLLPSQMKKSDCHRRRREHPKGTTLPCGT